jgi:CheY-like chemotaxis protein
VANAETLLDVPVLLPPESAPPPMTNEAGDDRESIQPGDRVLLIVENDLGFARVLLETAREKGFKGLVAPLGAAALTLTREFQPVAVTLDIYLPDIDGWRVLDRLKGDLTTRHIPVYVISTDDARERALRSAAFGFLAKPIQGKDVIEQFLESVKAYTSRSSRSIAIVDDDVASFNHLRQLIEDKDVNVTQLPNLAAALTTMNDGAFDCMVIVANHGDEDIAACAAAMQDHPNLRELPILFYDEGERLDESDANWKRCGTRGVVRHACSHERLVEQLSLFLHRRISALTPDMRRVVEDLHQSDKILSGRKLLIVDDDMRNIFALTTVLEDYGMQVVSAGNGRDAITMLKQAENDIEIVLMDIMMPEMDGIDTMRELRKLSALKNLPIIAVTAKAMKGDRERCIEAGAWDYLSKPVDTEQMLAVLRAWLYR